MGIAVKRSFHPYALLTILFWALAYVLTRLALRHFSALPLGFLRYAAASAVLVVVCLVRRISLPEPRDLPWFIAAGAAGFFLYMIAFNTGTGYVTAATSSVIIASAPVITALLASFVFREKLRGFQWLAIVIEFAGILVLTMYGAELSVNRGVPWLLLAALLLGIYNLLQRKLTRRYSAIQATAYSIFAGTLMLLVFAPQSVSELGAAPAVQILYVVLMGVFSSAIAYISWAKAMKLAPRTSMVSNYMFLTPFVTGIMGFLLAGEPVEAATWIGGGLIILGAVVFNRSDSTRAASPDSVDAVMDTDDGED